jgi:hypothetical protein
LDGYIEVRDVAEAAITEMDHLAVNLREVSTQHAVHVAKAVAGRYVHMSIMALAAWTIPTSTIPSISSLISYLNA